MKFDKFVLCVCVSCWWITAQLNQFWLGRKFICGLDGSSPLLIDGLLQCCLRVLFLRTTFKQSMHFYLSTTLARNWFFFLFFFITLVFNLFLLCQFYFPTPNTLLLFRLLLLPPAAHQISLIFLKLVWKLERSFWLARKPLNTYTTLWLIFFFLFFKFKWHKTRRCVRMDNVCAVMKSVNFF